MTAYLLWKRFLMVGMVLSITTGGLLSLEPVQAGQRSVWESLQRAIQNINPWREQPSRPIKVSSGDRSSGGPRDLCPTTAYPLTAFIPGAADKGQTYVEPVSSGHPTFWFYMPYEEKYPSRTSRRLEFALLDQNEQILYAEQFFLPQATGIISVPLPQTVAALQPGRRYRWVFSVICNPQNRAGDATVNGWIEEVSVPAAVSSQLTSVATSAERTLIYAEQQWWYETVSAIAAPAQPTILTSTDLESARKELLKVVGLPEGTPFVPKALCQSCLGIPAPTSSVRKPTATRPGL
jgi:Domain of Unknown Function (DUF928)